MLQFAAVSGGLLSYETGCRSADFETVSRQVVYISRCVLIKSDLSICSSRRLQFCWRNIRFFFKMFSFSKTFSGRSHNDAVIAFASLNNI